MARIAKGQSHRRRQDMVGPSFRSPSQYSATCSAKHRRLLLRIDILRSDSVVATQKRLLHVTV